MNVRQPVSPLQRAFIDARVVETVENYSRACAPQASAAPDTSHTGELFYFDPSTWVTGGTIASAAAQFLARIDREQHLPGVLEALALVLPQTLRTA